MLCAFVGAPVSALLASVLVTSVLPFSTLLASALPVSASLAAVRSAVVG